VEYFKKLKEYADPYNGSVILPGDFLKWIPGDGGDHLALVTDDLRLVHNNWKSTGPPRKTNTHHGHHLS
jgi:hypothetical protein